MSLGDRVIETADSLLECLRAALEASAAPMPAEVCLLHGDDPLGFLSLGTNVDRCCSGFAWVRVAGVVPKVPREGIDPGNCGIDTWQLNLEMGVARCSPFGDVTAPPGCDVLAQIFLTQQQDAEAMRIAGCCLRQEQEIGTVYPTAWQPFGPQGQCTGGIMGLSVAIDACGCIN